MNLYEKFLGDVLGRGLLRGSEKCKLHPPPPLYIPYNFLEIQGLPPTIHGAASGAAECMTDPPPIHSPPPYYNVGDVPQETKAWSLELRSNETVCSCCPSLPTKLGMYLPVVT